MLAREMHTKYSMFDTHDLAWKLEVSENIYWDLIASWDYYNEPRVDERFRMALCIRIIKYILNKRGW